MTSSAKERLFSLLFEEGRDLVNLKLLPGRGVKLTEDRVYDAAASALRQALEDKNRVSVPPHSGERPATLRELLPAR